MRAFVDDGDDASHPVIDILVNNAGTIRRTPAAEHPEEDWDHVIEVNLNSQFRAVEGNRQAGMLERGKWKNHLHRIAADVPGRSHRSGLFAASKGAIGQLTKALANEWAGRGVNVNAIAPGYIRTDNTQALQDDPVRSKAILERIPAGRWGDPVDFAGPVVFLASDASNYVDGTILTVDGGWMGR